MARMRVINADGSEAEMCGNGIRCVARFLYEAGSGEVLDLETGAGIMRTQVVARQPDFLVRVAMGIPRIEARALPIDRASFVDMGNPHVVLVRDAQEPFDLVRVGEFFQRDAVFTNGTNVHVMIPQPSGQLNVRHFERGVGLTMACGTGAVASAAVAIAERLATSPVEVVVPGGTLSVEWDGAGTAYLTGAAVRVFDTVL